MDGVDEWTRVRLDDNGCPGETSVDVERDDRMVGVGADVRVENVHTDVLVRVGCARVTQEVLVTLTVVDLQDEHDESNVLPELVVCEVVDYDVHVAGTDKVVMDPDFVWVFCGQSVFVFVVFVTHEVRRCVYVETDESVGASASRLTETCSST
jgi:hypothetical protein